MTIYTDNGTLIQSVKLSSVVHISVCRITGNVAFSCGLSGVSVMNDKLDLLFSYPSAINATVARGVIFDSSGHLLVAEGSDDKIHIVDAATGKALKTVRSLEKGHQWCLASYNDTIVVCSTFPDQLLSIKYLE